MGTEEKGGAKEKVEAMQKKFDVRATAEYCSLIPRPSPAPASDQKLEQRKARERD